MGRLRCRSRRRLEITGGGEFIVRDLAPFIEEEAAQTDAGALDDAVEVYSDDRPLALSVSEYKALADGDTSLQTGYLITDTAANIEAEMGIAYADGLSDVLMNEESLRHSTTPCSRSAIRHAGLQGRALIGTR